MLVEVGAQVIEVTLWEVQTSINLQRFPLLIPQLSIKII